MQMQRQSGATISTKTKFAHSIQHNNRDTEPNYLLPKQYQKENEYLYNKKDCFNTYKNEMLIRKEKYTERTNKKLPKNTAENISIILNLNENHSLKDIKPIIEYLENTLDIKVYNGAIHKDEGYISNDNQVNYNFHCHLEMLPLDSNGHSVTKKINRTFLMNLQKKVSEVLDMKYTPYTQQRKEGKTPTKRLDTHEYKRHKELETQELLKKDKQIQSLQTKLQEYQNNTTNTHIQTEQKNVQIEKYKDVETGFFNRDFYDKFLNKDVLHRRDEDKQEWEIIQKFFKNNDKIALLDINNLSALNKSLGYNETDLIIQNILDEIKKEIKDKQISCCRYRADLGKFILIGQEQEMNNLLNNLKSNSCHQAINKSLMDSGLYNTYDEKLHLKLMSSLSIGSAKFDSFGKIITEAQKDKTKQMKDVITAFKEGVTSAINKANDEMHTYKIVIKDKLGINYSEKYDNSKKQDMNNHYNSLRM
jgi:GGDEF domain-containing protein